MEPIYFKSKNDIQVCINDKTMQHMKAHHLELDLLEEAISLAEIGEVRSWAGMVDLGRIVGHDHKATVAPVGIDQPTLFAHRHNRVRPSHTILGVEPTQTSIITLIVNHFGIGGRTLISAWAGTLAMPEPRALQSIEHLSYWRSHALIWDENNFAEHPFVSTWREVLTKKKLEPVAI